MQTQQIISIQAADLNNDNHLGGGAYADVYYYQDSTTKAKYAIKCFKKNANEDEIKQEIQIYEDLKKFNYWHPNIIKYYGNQELINKNKATNKTTKQQLLIFECGVNSLAGLIQEEPEFFSSDFNQTKKIFMDFYSALLYLRIIDIANRDIKPQNIIYFLNKTKQISFKLTDFGVGKRNQSNFSHLTTQQTIIGTPLYLPPEEIAEYFNKENKEKIAKYNVFKADIYSLALTVLYLVIKENNQQMTWQEKLNKQTHVTKILELLKQFQQQFKSHDDQDELQHFVKIFQKMLEFDHSERLDAMDLYQHLSSKKDYYEIQNLNEEIIKWVLLSNITTNFGKRFVPCFLQNVLEEPENRDNPHLIQIIKFFKNNIETKAQVEELRKAHPEFQQLNILLHEEEEHKQVLKLEVKQQSAQKQQQQQQVDETIKKIITKKDLQLSEQQLQVQQQQSENNQLKSNDIKDQQKQEKKQFSKTYSSANEFESTMVSDIAKCQQEHFNVLEITFQ